ncbi:Gag-Pol polyprotein [Gossypium australe]|uniref:Gag-Pol polyprotein n=1 Tax=Gossypium australe TaxID=47621 RepID=A0A5B6VVX8_9ROSI|nr:Gag-Pol polyprotein [Gossypium australe]
MTVTEYKREFVRLSKYAREYVSTKEIMCKRFEDGLNEDIKLLVRILELKEFVVLVDKACKAEVLSKEKRRVDSEARDLRKRSMGKSYSSSSKKSKDSYNRSTDSVGYSNRDRGEQHTSPKAQVTLVSSIARAYAIRALEDASAPDVITGTLSLYDTNVIALIDPGSTHSYVCTNLVSSKSLPVESTEFMIKVSNPLGQYVLVDKVCKNCPLMTRGYCFSTDLMLLLFDEFNVILGMNWLTLHDAVVNYKRKTIEMKCQKLFIELVPVVCEYPDVFTEELPWLPLVREVEFAIELVLRTSPISIAPYRMALTELKELKAQLQELTDRGFARPSYSP